MVVLFQELVASRGLYVLLPLDEIKVFAPNLHSGKICLPVLLLPELVPSHRPFFLSTLSEPASTLPLLLLQLQQPVFSNNKIIGLFCHLP